MAFIRKYGSWLILLLVCNRLLLAAIGMIAIESFAPHFYKPEGHVHARSPLLIPWGAWDSYHYLDIAAHGYERPGGQISQLGWFPLYPLVIRLVSFLIGDLFISALFVSNLCLIGTLLLLGGWLAEHLGEEAAFQSVLFMVFFPSSIVLSGAFAESLFLLLLTASFYLLQRQRPGWACAVFSLTLVSRPLALPAVPFFVWALLFRQGRSGPAILRQLAPALLIPLPFLLYCFYMWRLTGNPFAYVDSKLAYNELQGANPLRIIWQALVRGITEHRFEHFFNACLILFSTAAVLANRPRLNWNYVALGLTLIWFPLLLNVWMLSASRYLAAVPPIFSGLALAGARGRLAPVLYMICLVLQGFLMVFWSTGSRFMI